MQATLDHARYKALFDKVYAEEFVNKYPDGYNIDWHEKPKSDWDKIKLAKSLPLDIFYKFYPITATWTIRKKHHNI